METGSGGGANYCRAEAEEIMHPSIPGHDVMMNHVILNHLFHLVSHQELNNYRQVCRHWYTTSLPAWLQNGPAIKLTKEEEFGSFLAQIGDGDSHHGGNMEGEIVGGIRKYRKFHLAVGYYDSTLKRRDRDRSWEQMESFLSKVVGTQLTHLSLYCSQYKDANQLQKFLRCQYTPNLEVLEARIINSSKRERRIQPDLPTSPCDAGVMKVVVENANLTTLKIEYSDIVSDKRPSPIKWEEFLGQFPNLKCFGVGLSLSSNRREVEAILKAIKEIRDEDKSKLELKSFLSCFNGMNFRSANTLAGMLSFPPTIYNLLRQAQLNIEDLQIGFSIQVSDELLHNLLSLYANSLRKLEFYRLTLLQTHPFSDMTRLQSLTVSGFPLKSLDFLRELPSLLSLCLWGDNLHHCTDAPDIIRSTSLTDEEGAATVSFPSLAKFCCNYLARWTADDIAHLQSLLPGLSHLEMLLNNETFRLVCRNWPRLEHLSIYGNAVGDLGIVGLVNEGDQAIYSEPNITSLRYLKSFAIETLSFKFTFREGELTWRSVVHGLSNLPNLQKLVVESSEQVEIRDVILEAIPFAKVIVKRATSQIPRYFARVEEEEA